MYNQWNGVVAYVGQVPDLPFGSKVEVVLSDNRKMIDAIENFAWWWDEDEENDIVAYRVVEANT